MVMTDPIADMLTRIRNANAIKNATATIPSSKLKLEIARILKEEGYISDFVVEGEEKKNIVVTLKYVNNERAITGLKRISKPGLRVYVEASNMPKVLNGLGIAIVSTNKGLVTDRQARALKVGGEVLAFVW